MKKVFVLFGLVFFLCGCAGVKNCPDLKSALEKPSPPSSSALKNILAQDLRSGKIAIGSSIDAVRLAYGQPDDILVVGCVVRILYRQEKAKNINLWFNDGTHLSMWSN